MSDYFRKNINLVESLNKSNITEAKQTDFIYVVKNEHTLGYVNPSQSSGTMYVIAGKPQLGGHDWKNGSVAITRLDAVRAATEKDFDFFRVELPPDFYDQPKASETVSTYISESTKVDLSTIGDRTVSYLTKEDVKAIRDTLKKEFPKFKFSVRRADHSKVAVSILSGPVKFVDKDYSQINIYHLNNYNNSDILKRMVEIINFKNYDNSDVQSDYFDVGYYVSLSVGDWDKPYVYTGENVSENTEQKTHQFTQEFKRLDGTTDTAIVSVKNTKNGYVGVVKIGGKSKVVTTPVYDMNDAFTLILRKLDQEKEKIVEGKNGENDETDIHKLNVGDKKMNRFQLVDKRKHHLTPTEIAVIKYLLDNRVDYAGTNRVTVSIDSKEDDVLNLSIKSYDGRNRKVQIRLLGENITENEDKKIPEFTVELIRVGSYDLPHVKMNGRIIAQFPIGREAPAQRFADYCQRNNITTQADWLKQPGKVQTGYVYATGQEAPNFPS